MSRNLAQALIKLRLFIPSSFGFSLLPQLFDPFWFILSFHRFSHRFRLLISLFAASFTFTAQFTPVYPSLDHSRTFLARADSGRLGRYFGRPRRLLGSRSLIGRADFRALFLLVGEIASLATPILCSPPGLSNPGVSLLLQTSSMPVLSCKYQLNG